jgi:CRP/FNR family cyclic AMP-dependent transcriptional regulator
MRKALYILGQLSDADIEWLIGVGSRRVLGDGDILISEGQAADALSIVLDGSLVVDVGGTVIAELGVGEIVGEMSFVDATPPSATVRASPTCLVLCVPRAVLSRHLEEDLGFAVRFYRALAMVLSGRVREVDARLAGTNAGELGAEIDMAVLDTVHLAGARFDHILQKLANR